MKRFLVLLLTVLSLHLSAQQSTSPLFLHHSYGQTASAIDYSFTAAIPADKDDECRKAKRLRKTGKVLIFSGVGMAGASLVLATAGFVYSMRHESDYTFYDPAEGIYIASGVVGGVGMLAIFSGIPTLAVGRYKYSCPGDIRRHGHRAYISTNGTNLALNF
ncbi:MAG: hypothetical protein JSS76_01850 [Bacteroidetes bacterium]|nr:hypothetical protein [Bacteroidota bacterium]MBS1683467.1 hypothetical protein [Bacteroidota bacterium]